MLPKTLSILRKFGRSRLTGRDFVSLCSKNKIEIVISHDVRRGFYYYANGMHTIVLSAMLPSDERLLVGWHEFAHFLQNFRDPTPVAAFSNVQPDADEEKLADIFAKIALQPEDFRVTGPMDFIKMIMRGGQ